MSSPSEPPSPSAAETDLAGRQLGDFLLLRRLGRGAMAEVYLAEQSSLRRRVAVKVLKPELAGDPVYLKRFEREARSAASLVHGNIVQIYEVGHIGQIHFIVQEYVQGENLRQWLSRHGPMDLGMALTVMRQVAAALSKAADAGLVHRDIKPENIMLTPAGEVKVADFGLARVSREDQTTDLTQEGLTVGTPLYMSPEQAEGKPLDPRSDIYSFGATCYHLLSGGPPFQGETALGVAVQHLKRQPQPLESSRPDLPAALCRLVHRMLAKAPENRYQSPRELVQELQGLAQQYGCPWPESLPDWDSTAKTTATARAELTQHLSGLMKAAAPGRPRRRLPLVAGGVVVAFSAGAALAWWVAREPSLPTPADSAMPAIAKQETALQQWYYASAIGTEEAWQSIPDYFPEKQYLARRAKQQLARIYLRKSDYERALELFRELAAADESDEELRAFALAGQCGVLSLQGKYRQSAAVADQLWPIHKRLKDPQMRKLVTYALQKNRSKLAPETTRQWDQWLKEQFRQEG